MIGETVGNFVITSRLGRGGMGEVFLAKHKELETLVAIKILNEDISEDRDHVQRFFNEARIVSKIRHAGTIKIFDSGFIKGHAYLVMELLEGESLAPRLRRGALPTARAIEVSRQIASVLEATHRAGVIHRDLKPDNIYLIGDDERASGERVKVLDFGIAKLSGTLAPQSPKTVGMMGTPAYMAPEQWRDTGAVDWRADAYALGCVMFEMACGCTPFIAQTIPEAYAKHTHDAPPSPCALKPSLPRELGELILRLLAKDPAARAQSMADVVRELEVIATLAAHEAGTAATIAPAPVPGAPIVVHSTTLGGTAAELESPAPREQRRPIALIGALVASAAIGIAIVVGVTRTSSEPVVPAAAPPPTADATAPPAQPPSDASASSVPSDAPGAAAIAVPSHKVPTATVLPAAKGSAAPTSTTPVTPSDDEFGGRR